MILATPNPAHSWNRRRVQEILEVQHNLARAILDRGEDLMILESPGLDSRWRADLPEEIFFAYSGGHVWIRDFAPIVGAQVCSFCYPFWQETGSDKTSTAGLDDLQSCRAEFLEFLQCRGSIPESCSTLRVDAGHVLYNYGPPGQRIALVSHRVVIYNRKEKHIRRRLEDLLGVDRVIFVPDPGDARGHLHDTMCFLEPGLLMMQNPGPRALCRPAARSRWDRISEYLSQTLPDLQQFIFPWPAGKRAISLYANCIVTERTIYVPHYEMPGDFLILERMQEQTGKELVAVESGPVALLGGSLRRMTWQPPLHWGPLLYPGASRLSDELDMTRKNLGE